MGEKVTLRQSFLRVLRVYPCQYDTTSAPFSFIHINATTIRRTSERILRPFNKTMHFWLSVSTGTSSPFVCHWQVKERDYEGADWIHVAKERDHWRVLWIWY